HSRPVHGHSEWDRRLLSAKRLVSSAWRSYLAAQIARALLIVDARCKRMPPAFLRAQKSPGRGLPGLKDRSQLRVL
ncbi:MAG: hypothetical protein WBE14_25110, partial [Xanthobacteraceae bacterium]